jgi:transcriptional regulator with XRE-family HTH domain
MDKVRLTDGGLQIPMPARILEGDFAGWLRDAMAARGLSTRGLASRCGIDHSTIYRLAKGSRQPPLATALALIKVLGTETLHNRGRRGSRRGGELAATNVWSRPT